MVTFCANDMRLFSIVECAGFLDFCQSLIKIGARKGNINANDIMPFRTTISKNIEDKYEKLKEIFFNKIESIEYFGITLDIWTNIYTNTAFLCVTSFYWRKWKWFKTRPRKLCFENTEMKGNKTGLKIRENLEEILKEMKCFRAENTNTYVSDN